MSLHPIGDLQVIVISGLSGSGKSAAVNAFEDLGSYCVDNLPTALLPKMLELFGESTMDLKQVVLGMDIREGRFLKDFPSIFRQLKESGMSIRLIFLEADEKVLVQRYSETRRVHPLGGEGSLLEAIRREMSELAPLRELADEVIDTSTTSVRDLRQRVMEVCREKKTVDRLSVTVLSFGFKYGLPFEADLVFDVRFLKNPFFVPSLKHQTGLDDAVREYVLSGDETKQFLEELFRFLAFVMPRYREDGKSYLTIAVGCTGGRHRSVVIARAVAEYLEKEGYNMTVRNRDIQAE